MFLLGRAMNLWYTEYSNEPLNWYKVPYVVQEMAKLIKAYLPSTELLTYDIGKSIPLWKGKNLLVVFRILIKLPSGTLLYDQLYHEMGRSIVDSLVEHNTLHLCLTNL